MRSIVCFLAGTVVATSVLAGCQSGHPAGPAPDTVVADGPALDLVTQTGSFRRHQHVLTVAEERLVGQCMTAQGLPYPERSEPADSTDDERILAERRRRGYGLAAAGPAADRPVGAADRYVRTLPVAEQKAYTRALFGDDAKRRGIELPRSGQVTFPGDGCLYQAQTRIFGDILTWARITYLPEDLSNKLADQATSSAAYVEALRDWSRCMARRGYRYANPDAAEADLRERYKAGESEELRTVEIATAVADAECAAQVGISALLVKLKKDAVGNLSKTEQQSLNELSRAWLRAATTADALV